MSVKNHGVINLNEKTICGISVDIFSIMMKDLYDPSAIPNTWQKFWKEFPKDSVPSDSKAYGVEFPKAELEMRPAPHFELYDANLNPNSDDYSMGILIPVI